MQQYDRGMNGFVQREGIQSIEPIRLVEKSWFGSDFKWGVSSAAYQTEGAWDADGKGLSIWDQFTKGGLLRRRLQSATQACEFYHRYREDLHLMRYLNIPNFRFSISWPRLLPNGTGKVNEKGLGYYDRLIDTCLELGIEPWVTLYHWDLPQALERKGGWTNREILHWFGEYVHLVADTYGDRVKHWMVLNEPMVFTGAGYFLGLHAPGKRGLGNFLPAVHHAALCQAEGGRILKNRYPDSEVGTTFSCSHVEPYRDGRGDEQAANRVDALLNRLFVEPALGLGYPLQDLPRFRSIERYMKAGDEHRLRFDFDFVGIQNYTREVVRRSWLVPLIQASIVKANSRKAPSTEMNWEVYPRAIYKMVKQFNNYPNIPKIYITENGAAFPDQQVNGKVHDELRIRFIRDHIAQVYLAKQEGMRVGGYFVWSFTDNFEWAEGFRPRFGLVYIDYKSQNRIVKSSGYWYKSFLGEELL